MPTLIRFLAIFVTEAIGLQKTELSHYYFFSESPTFLKKNPTFFWPVLLSYFFKFWLDTLNNNKIEIQLTGSMKFYPQVLGGGV
jgi:hypothetical protein